MSSWINSWSIVFRLAPAPACEYQRSYHNLANVALGGEKGKYTPIHPNDHVNMGQSTNDTIPTAIRLACLAKTPRLIEAIYAMAAEFERIAERERDTVKSGRTHLQDAVPTTLGREFAAYAWTLRRVAQQLANTHPRLGEIGLGGSAAGTGLNTAPDYPERVAQELADLTGEPIAASHLTAQMQSMLDLQMLSGVIRGLALELTRISNDLRLLAWSAHRFGRDHAARCSGLQHHAGQGESGDVRNAQPVCYQVLGQDAAVAYMTQAGQLELNVMMPALGSALFDAMDWLTNAMNAATEKNLKGLTVNRERCSTFIHASVGLATLLNPQIGYMKAAEIAKESEQSGKPVREIVAAHGIMSVDEFDALVLKAARDGKV